MAVSNLGSIVGKDVYTKYGKFIGKVDDAMLDSERGAVYGLVIQMAKDSFVYKFFEQEGGAKKAILIPHRHIIAAEDIVLVSMPDKYSASQVSRPAEPEESPEPEADLEPEL